MHIRHSTIQRCLCKTNIIPQKDFHVMCVFEKYPPTISELITVFAGHHSSGSKGDRKNNHQPWTYHRNDHRPSSNLDLFLSATRAINPGHNLWSPIAFMHWSRACRCLSLLRTHISRLVLAWCDGSAYTASSKSFQKNGRIMYLNIYCAAKHKIK